MCVYIYIYILKSNNLFLKSNNPNLWGGEQPQPVGWGTIEGEHIPIGLLPIGPLPIGLQECNSRSTLLKPGYPQRDSFQLSHIMPPLSKPSYVYVYVYRVRAAAWRRLERHLGEPRRLGPLGRGLGEPRRLVRHLAETPSR